LKGRVVRNEINGRAIAGVQVSASGASPQVSSNPFGTFALEFRQKNAGDRVSISVAMRGMVVVNWKELNVVLPRDEDANVVTVVLALESDKDEMLRRFVGLPGLDRVETIYKNQEELRREERAALLNQIEQLKVAKALLQEELASAHNATPLLKAVNGYYDAYNETLQPALFNSRDTTAVVLDGGVLSIWPIENNPKETAPLDVSKSIESFKLSPDRRTVAAIGRSGVVTLFSVLTRQSAGRLPAAGMVHAMEFSASGRWLATIDTTGIIEVFDVETKRTARRIAANNDVKFLSISDTGELIAYADKSGSVTVASLRDQNVIATAVAGSDLIGLAFTKDGSQIVLASETGRVRILSAAGGKKIDERALPLNLRDDPVLSRDGRYLAVKPYRTREYAQFEIHIISVMDGREMRIYGNMVDLGLDDLAFTADSTGLVVYTHTQSGGGAISNVDIWELDPSVPDRPMRPGGP
jgi:WD40 repeat protein